MGKLKDFEIEFSQTQGVFHAGTCVSGQVVVDLSEPMKMRSLSLWLYGKGKVHWTKRKRSNKHNRTIHYRAEEIYIDQTVPLFGSSEGDQMHPAGRHTYPFEFPLAGNLPSSFEGEHGYVRYFCKATIDKPWKFDHDVKNPFTVLSILDLNTEPGDLMSPMRGEDHAEVSCCCCVSGDVKASFLIDRRGYVPGEVIYVNAEIVNDSNTTVSASRVAIKQYTEFYGRSDSLFSSGELKPKCESAVIAQMAQGEVGERQTGKWENVPIRIPAIPPSRLVGCNIINIAYVIKFYVEVSYGTNIKLASDLVIGTVPVHQLRPRPPAGGAIVDQPAPSAPSQDFEGASAPPPPSYEESVTGRRNIGEDHDSKYTRGTLDWAPHYPTYNLDSQYNTQYTDWQPSTGNRV